MAYLGIMTDNPDIAAGYDVRDALPEPARTRTRRTGRRTAVGSSQRSTGDVLRLIGMSAYGGVTWPGEDHRCELCGRRCSPSFLAGNVCGYCRGEYKTKPPEGGRPGVSRCGDGVTNDAASHNPIIAR